MKHGAAMAVLAWQAALQHSKEANTTSVFKGRVQAQEEQINEMKRSNAALEARKKAEAVKKDMEAENVRSELQAALLQGAEHSNNLQKAKLKLMAGAVAQWLGDRRLRVLRAMINAHRQYREAILAHQLQESLRKQIIREHAPPRSLSDWSGEENSEQNDMGDGEQSGAVQRGQQPNTAATQPQPYCNNRSPQMQRQRSPGPNKRNQERVSNSGTNGSTIQQILRSHPDHDLRNSYDDPYDDVVIGHIEDLRAQLQPRWRSP